MEESYDSETLEVKERRFFKIQEKDKIDKIANIKNEKQACIDELKDINKSVSNTYKITEIITSIILIITAGAPMGLAIYPLSDLFLKFNFSFKINIIFVIIEMIAGTLSAEYIYEKVLSKQNGNISTILGNIIQSRNIKKSKILEEQIVELRKNLNEQKSELKNIVLEEKDYIEKQAEKQAIERQKQEELEEKARQKQEEFNERETAKRFQDIMAIHNDFGKNEEQTNPEEQTNHKKNR